MEKTLITVGLKCPRPLIEVHKAVKSADAGMTMEVIADDPAFKLDIVAWCRRTGNELLSLEEQSGQFIARLRKPSPGEIQ
jgi:TusA-related sulfurtransferase